VGGGATRLVCGVASQGRIHPPPQLSLLATALLRVDFGNLLYVIHFLYFLSPDLIIGPKNTWAYTALKIVAIISK
jgi:hypothetical protein